MEALLIFIRIGGIIFALPIFGDSPVPVRVRMLMSVAFTCAATPMMDGRFLLTAPDDVLVLMIMLLKELTIGLLIGFVARVAFAGILMGASIVAYQMGFGTATLFMPDTNAHMDAFSAFHRIFVMLVFLSLDLHHLFIRAIFRTFEVVPAGSAMLKPALAPFLIKITSALFTVAIQLAAPLLIALMFTMAALGLVARAVPQLNVFTMSFPASFFVGLLIYIATLTLYPQWLTGHFHVTEENLWLLIRGLAPQRP